MPKSALLRDRLLNAVLVNYSWTETGIKTDSFKLEANKLCKLCWRAWGFPWDAALKPYFYIASIRQARTGKQFFQISFESTRALESVMSRHKNYNCANAFTAGIYIAPLQEGYSEAQISYMS